MADTIRIEVFNTQWTEVNLGSVGTIQNTSGNMIFIRESAILPDPSVSEGHSLNPKRSLRYNLTAGQKVYCCSTVSGFHSVFVTAD